MPLRTLGVLALVAALAVSSCSDDPQPKVAPEPSPSTSSATASPSTAPGATSPAEAVRMWVRAQNDALVGGDTADVRSLSTPNCESCEGLIAPIEQVYEAGGYFETSGWRIDRAELDMRADSKARVNTAITIAGGRTVNAGGEAPVAYEVDKRIVTFELREMRGRWLVSFIGFL